MDVSFYKPTKPQLRPLIDHLCEVNGYYKLEGKVLCTLNFPLEEENTHDNPSQAPPVNSFDLQFMECSSSQQNSNKAPVE